METEINFKVGDWVYTKQYGLGFFQIIKIEGNKLYNMPHGWAEKNHSTIRKAEYHEIPEEYRNTVQEVSPIFNIF
jgi:hypothetical protein